MSGYLIYHPPRQKSDFGNTIVYHDHIRPGNQDPYVWNYQFLHTYCHITQMSPEPGDINFWVSANNLNTFTELYCDLVFVVKDKIYWAKAKTNSMDSKDAIVDTPEAYNDHYYWAGKEHYFKKRPRYTLKADALKSFQPQNEQHQLIDILPILRDLRFPLEQLRSGMRAGFNSKPFKLDDTVKVQELYKELENLAAIKVTGSQLQPIRKANKQLASGNPEVKSSKC